MKKENYLNFLRTKFGSHVVDVLVNREGQCLKLVYGEPDDVYAKDFLDENRKKIKEFILDERLVQEKPWAFDFPGWVGDLDLSKGRPKELMVIGMEPHIRSRFYQVTYGLRETYEGTFKEFSEGANFGLWSNLYALFNNGESSCTDHQFLARIYITDLCHFTVRGFAGDVYKIDRWTTIRNEIAERFLKDEIAFVNPKYLVSQGNDVAAFIDNLLSKYGKKVDGKTTQDLRANPKLDFVPKCVSSPAFRKYSYNGQTVIHVHLPHIASGNSNYFWIPAAHNAERRKILLAALKEELEAFSN